MKIKGLYQKREFFYFQPPMVQGVRPKPIALRTKNLHEAIRMATELPWVTPHVMRHTFATLHIQAGTPLATVARWLGDSYAVTFAHYAAYAPTDAHIRNLD